MRKRIFIIFLLVFFVSASASCAALSEEQRLEYGILESAVTFSSDKVIGEYGDTIPDNFTEDAFMKFVKDRIPEDYYKVLKKYRLDVRPKGSYYLLLVINPNTSAVILFDFSCTPQIDGPVLLDPNKYDVKKIDSYDRCKE
jgi:hypothetical protein